MQRLKDQAQSLRCVECAGTIGLRSRQPHKNVSQQHSDLSDFVCIEGQEKDSIHKTLEGNANQLLIMRQDQSK